MLPGLLVFLCASAVFSTDFRECFSLNSFYDSSLADTQVKIGEYEKKLLVNPGDYYADLAIGILYEDISASGRNPDPSYSINVVKYTEKFLRRSPDDPFAMVYLGLGHSLVCRDSTNKLTQYFEINNAISIFDKAVYLAGGRDIEWFVRYMRGNFFMNLPESFNKTKYASDDFEFVLKAYSIDPGLESYMIVTYYYLGELKKSKGDIDKAVDFWNKSVALNQKLKLNVMDAAKARKELDIFSSESN